MHTEPVPLLFSSASCALLSGSTVGRFSLLLSVRCSPQRSKGVPIASEVWTYQGQAPLLDLLQQRRRAGRNEMGPLGHLPMEAQEEVAAMAPRQSRR